MSEPTERPKPSRLDGFVAILDVLAELDRADVEKLVDLFRQMLTMGSLAMLMGKPDKPPRVVVGRCHCTECRGQGSVARYDSDMSLVGYDTCVACDDGWQAIQIPKSRTPGGLPSTLVRMALSLLEMGSGSDSPEYECLVAALRKAGYSLSSLGQIEIEDPE